MYNNIKHSYSVLICKNAIIYLVDKYVRTIKLLVIPKINFAFCY